MRVSVIVAALAVALSGCSDVGKPTAAKAEPAAADDGFPVKGDYHRISDRTVIGQLQRMETDGPLDASTRETFEQLVAGFPTSNCRDRQVDIGNGSFSVSMTCYSSYGGDTVLKRHGRYSKDSVDIAFEMTSGGGSTLEMVTYRLNRE